VLRGWMVGHSSECFSFVKDWEEKKIRRHMLRARNRKGFGWTQWSRGWLYQTLGLFNSYRVAQRQHRKPPRQDRSISLEAKQTGERSARKSACCVRRGGGWKRGMVEML